MTDSSPPGTEEELARLLAELEAVTARSEELERRLAVEETVTFVSGCFVGVADLDRAITRSLERMGQVCGASHVHVFLSRDQGQRVDNTHEWCAEGVAPQMHRLQDMAPAGLPWLWDRLARGEIIHIPDTAIEDDSGPGTDERARLHSNDVRSLLALHLKAGRSQLGFLSFVDSEKPRRWDRQAQRILTLAAHLLGAALERQRIDRARAAAALHAELLRGALADMGTRVEIGDMIDRVLDGLNSLLPFRSACALVLLDGGRIHHPWSGSEDPDGCQPRGPAMGNMLEAVQGAGAPVVLDGRHGTTCGTATCEQWKRHLMAAIPLPAGGEIESCLVLCSDDGAAFGREELALASALAAEAGLAIENARLLQRIQVVATTDALTGLTNRRHFYEQGVREVNRCRRYGHPLSSIMVDVDNFKRINDTHGHRMGDRVLQRVAELCRGGLRDSDLVCRYGGDEFAILLPETDLDRAMQTAERLRSTLAEARIGSASGDVEMTGSFGVAALADSGNDTLETLLERADASLYDAKRGGRDRVETGEMPEA